MEEAEDGTAVEAVGVAAAAGTAAREGAADAAAAEQQAPPAAPSHAEVSAELQRQLEDQFGACSADADGSVLTVSVDEAVATVRLPSGEVECSDWPLLRQSVAGAVRRALVALRPNELGA